MEAGRREILEAADGPAAAKSRMLALTTLLRLRQICCDARLLAAQLGKSEMEPSGKVELFGELLEEILDGGHRVLVFSQFTTMLGLLREELQARELEYCYLDGSTTDRARDAWFVGYTPDLVTGVWVGFDDRQPLGAGEEGARAAVPIWTNFMREYVRVRHPPAIEFARPDGVTALTVDGATGLLPAPGAAATTTLEEYYFAGTEPHDAVSADAGIAADASADAGLPTVLPLPLPVAEPDDAAAPIVENPVAPAADDAGPPLD